jgi:nitric oxide reductase NorE protein
MARMPYMTTATLAAEPSEPPRLRGDLAVWLVIAAELVTFGLLFATFAFARVAKTEVFTASQATLDLRFGIINTLLLISGSAGVAHAVRSLRQERLAASQGWWVMAIACGIAFLLLKLMEYSAKTAAGIGLETNTFYMFYFLLTGFHFLHVAAGVLFLAICAVQTRRGVYGPQSSHVPETAAAFWHMVDLLWIVLFPLVYVMR